MEIHPVPHLMLTFQENLELGTGRGSKLGLQASFSYTAVQPLPTPSGAPTWLTALLTMFPTSLPCSPPASCLTHAHHDFIWHRDPDPPEPWPSLSICFQLPKMLLQTQEAEQMPEWWPPAGTPVGLQVVQRLCPCWIGQRPAESGSPGNCPNADLKVGDTPACKDTRSQTPSTSRAPGAVLSPGAQEQARRHPWLKGLLAGENNDREQSTWEHCNKSSESENGCRRPGGALCRALARASGSGFDGERTMERPLQPLPGVTAQVCSGVRHPGEDTASPAHASTRNGGPQPSATNTSLWKNLEDSSVGKEKAEGSLGPQVLPAPAEAPPASIPSPQLAFPPLEVTIPLTFTLIVPFAFPYDFTTSGLLAAMEAVPLCFGFSLVPFHRYPVRYATISCGALMHWFTDVYISVNHFERPRWADHLRSVVRDQPCRHGIGAHFQVYEANRGHKKNLEELGDSSHSFLTLESRPIAMLGGANHPAPPHTAAWGTPVIKMRSRNIAQAGLQLLAFQQSSQSAGITGTNHGAWPGMGEQPALKRTRQAEDEGMLAEFLEARRMKFASPPSATPQLGALTAPRKKQSSPPEALWEAEAGRSRGQEFETSLANMVKPVPTKNTKISWARWHAPVVPATREAEAEESLEPGVEVASPVLERLDGKIT
ncbi:hypothetical protein AAY473_004687 [Plecturocebus cupreus]